jgi:hypothetical protein
MNTDAHYPEAELLTWKLVDLKSLCKIHRLPDYGTKRKIVNRIVNAQEANGYSRSRKRRSPSTASTTPTKRRKFSDFEVESEVSAKKCAHCNEVYGESSLGAEGGVTCYNCSLRDVNQVDSVVRALLPATMLRNLRDAEFIVSSDLAVALSAAKGAMQIQIRCTQVGAKLHMWPKDCLLFINDTVIFESSQFQGQSFPMNVTAALSIGRNSLKVESRDADFVLGLYIVQRQDVNSLIATLLRTEKITSSAALSSRFGGNCKISCICPLTNTRIRWPARGELCDHIECFDLKHFFLRLEAAPAELSCPICDLPVLKPQLDFALLSIFEQSQNEVAREHS